MLDDALLARLRQAERRRVAVALRVLREVLEARVAVARAPRGVGVNLVEEAEHGLDRSVEAVEVEAVEADALAPRRERLVVAAQPLGELDDHAVAPHPGGEALETAERLFGLFVSALAAHVAVDAVSVRPVGLDGDGVEAFLNDQPLSDFGALAVELVRAVRRLAQKHEARFAHQLQQRVVIRRRAFEHVRRLAHEVCGECVLIDGHDARFPLSPHPRPRRRPRSRRSRPPR